MPRPSLLFDLDGTLTDPKLGIINCLCHALEACGAEIPDRESLIQYIGPPLQQAFQELLGPTRTELVPYAIQAYRGRFSEAGMYENRVYHGVPETLSALAPRFDLWVATSKPQVFASEILRHFGLHTYFQGIHGAELDGTRSDKKELIAWILSTHQIDAHRASMIGDRKHDMWGAAKNGVRPLGALWGYGTDDELRSSGAEAVFEKPMELPVYFSLAQQSRI